MVERAPQLRRDEQYPLLKVAGGGGDGGVHQQPSQALPGPGWGVTCTPKKSWSFRWPEYISTCWMTFILLGISFLVFYALGMEVYRRQAVLIIKCNTTKPASDVYYHHIVRRGSACPFMLYADYLSNVATQYPELRFHVIFLVDDSLYATTYRGQRINIFKNLMPRNQGGYPFIKVGGTDGKREIADFERRYQNVNVTIMTINKFMAKTPSMPHNWRVIPLPYITFYARVLSVWENGGVAMDLNHFNNNYNNRKCVDRRISTILKQHNDGIKVEEYTNALNKIDREEENEFFTVFYSLVHQLLNETRTFFTKSFPFTQLTTADGASQNERLVRTNRNKRDVSTPINDKNNKSEAISNVYVETINSTKETDLKKSEYQLLSNPDVNLDKLKLTINDAFKALQVNNSSIVNGKNKTEGLNKSDIQTEKNKKSDSPQVVLFYDFSVFSDGSAPSYVLPKALMHTDFRQNKKVSEFGKAGKSENDEVHLLSIDSDGMFVAASSRLHPFLGHLISAGISCQRIHPKFAIQDTLLTQCSGLFTEDSFCNNIYLL